jgi:hypothetical protein
VTRPFEIFQAESDGNILWRGSAASLEEANSMVKELTAKTPGDFFIWNHQTGKKLALGGCDADKPANSSELTL